MKNQKVLIWGLGKSGRGVLSYLLDTSNLIFLFDDNGVNKEWAQNYNVFVIEKMTKQIAESMDIIVISPSVKINELLKYAISKGVQVMPELEFAYRNCKNTFYAITGTNGKTTTTSILGHIVSCAKRRVTVAGNIGVAVSSVISKQTKKDAFVCEVSSFQLENIDRFKPHIAAITNITVDHLDFHKTFKNYISAKYKIAKNMTIHDYLVLNKDCNISQKIISPAQRYYFGFEKLKGTYCIDNTIYFSDKKTTKIIDVKDIKLLGRHNIENIMCAITMAMLMKIKPKIIKKAISSFEALPHRLQQVACINGVTFINDSKATNIDSTITAINSMVKSTHLILGGSDKGYEFDEIFKSDLSNVIQIYAYGATASKIVEAAKRQNYLNITSYKCLKDAVMASFDNARDNEVVLLSPATASFDEFENYVDRGLSFEKYCKELEE